MNTQEAIEFFQAFLRIPTVSTTGVTSGSYRVAADWLTEQLQTLLGAEVEEIEATPGKPVVVATLKGKDESLPVLLVVKTEQGYKEYTSDAFVPYLQKK